MKIAIAYEAGSVAKSLGTCQEFLIVTAQDGQPTGKELVTCSGEGHVRLLGFIGQYAVDVLICGELGIASRNALEMLGVLLVPGVTGGAEEAAAKFLIGERQGDDTVLSLCREDDPDDPMACMHDCSKCAGCGPLAVDLSKLDLPDVK
ncbi:MAG: hypothetical protein KHY76_07800 [Butyricicoccus pullicaecorum]|nr:hypothetical protein [Butyricicoccus pullicaecorum]